MPEALTNFPNGISAGAVVLTGPLNVEASDGESLIETIPNIGLGFDGIRFNGPLGIGKDPEVALDIIQVLENPRSSILVRNPVLKTGISLDPFWSTLNFNSYHNGVSKVAVGPYPVGVIHLNQNTGNLTIACGSAPGEGNTVSEYDNIRITNAEGYVGIQLHNKNPVALLHVGDGGPTPISAICSNIFHGAGHEFAYMGDWSKLANVATYGTDMTGTGGPRNVQIVVGGVTKLDYGVTATGVWTFKAPIVQTPATTATPTNNGEMTFSATSNTQVTVRLRGSDAVVRSVVLTLA